MTVVQYLFIFDILGVANKTKNQEIWLSSLLSLKEPDRWQPLYIQKLRGI